MHRTGSDKVAWNLTLRVGRMAVCAAFLACVLLAVQPVFALPPHVATTTDTDTCAMCHRTHTSPSDVSVEATGGTPANALIVGVIRAGQPDADLCYVCHGVDQLGSSTDVEDSFRGVSAHKLTPSPSAYGPAKKQCSSCHDSHGTNKTASGTPYPKLLRSADASGADVFNGDSYCGACHSQARGRWAGMAVWNQTAHARLATTTSGTDIVCSVCHQPHGSSNNALVAETLTPPQVPATTTVPANDRRFCFACHPSAERTYPGASAFDAASHGSSAVTVAVTAQWATLDSVGPDPASRRVGECQNCHAPMGASDGAGGVVGRMLAAPEPVVCYQCHRSSGPASTNMVSAGYTPDSAVVEIAASFGSTSTPQFSAAEVFTRAATSSADIIGPRTYVSDAVGASAIGDVDGDGNADLVVARSGTSTITVLSRSPLYGLAPSLGDMGLALGPASFVSVADVLPDAMGFNEIVTADGHDVTVYRWTGSGLAPVGTKTLTGSVTGMATGPISSDSISDIAITTQNPDSLALLSGSSGTLELNGEYVTRRLPTGPSVGDLNGDGFGEIAIANGGETTGVVSVFSGSGAELTAFGESSDASATSTRIGDIFPSTAGIEIAATLASPTAAARLEVFPRSGPVFGDPVIHSLADRSNPSAVAFGDVDGDSAGELVVGEGGLLSGVANQSAAPGVEVVNVDPAGTGLGSSTFLPAGGAQMAGTANVAIGQLGSIGPSRHPVEALAASHVSTESVTVPAHVACSDCHNSHAAVAATATITSPEVPGPMRGVWGVSVLDGASGVTLADKFGVGKEYEVCLKCHSTWSNLGLASLASQLSTRNASFHPVEGPAPDTNAVGTLTGVAPGATIYCDDCHGNSGSGPKGPHSSPDAPLLRAPYASADPADSSMLCYQCHRYEVYGSGASDDLPATHSGFTSAILGTAGKLHSRHTLDGFACSSCHVTHGSPDLPYLLRSDIGWAPQSGGGACSGACHDGSSQSYAR